MKIVNETGWSTEDLRRITAEIARRELDPYQRRGLGIRFLQGRVQQWIRGRCYVGIVKGKSTAKLNRGGLYLRVWLPSLTRPCATGREANVLDMPQLAYVLAHEMAHARGLRHPEMRGGPYMHGHDPALYAYASAFTVIREAPRAIDRDATKRKAVEHARAMVKRWETRCKRDATALKGWRRRLAARTRVLETPASLDTIMDVPLDIAASPAP